jgi:putative membrane protein
VLAAYLDAGRFVSTLQLEVPPMTPEARPAGASTSQSPDVPLNEPAVSAQRGNMSASHTPDVSTDTQKASAEIPPNLALMNTLMAADRTLMAWTRTSLSMLSFGFTIYKILEEFQNLEGKAVVRTHVPRDAGLFLTGMGTLAMVMGTIEYWQSLRTLHQPRIYQRPRAPLIIALIMSLMGVLLFSSIIAKVL